MKFGIRVPSLKKRISARLSIKRAIRAKIRAPKGFGIITNPKKFIYNKISISSDQLVKKTVYFGRVNKIDNSKINNILFKAISWLFFWPILLPFEIIKYYLSTRKKQEKYQSNNDL